MNSHTPGPWMYQATAGDHDFLIYPESTGRDVALVRDFNEANACLIAAAPEMYEALQDLVKALPASSSKTPKARWNAEARARAAIRQAGGRDQ